MLKRLGFNFQVVAGAGSLRWKFPDGEIAESGKRRGAAVSALSWQQKTDADLVIATDPDCDRMGVAVRNRAGEMKLLTGNQIGSLMAYYRAKTLFDQRRSERRRTRTRGVIIKTFVTTDLQKAIARTLWIALRRDADRIQIHRRETGQIRARAAGRRGARNIASSREEETRALRLAAFFLLRFRRRRKLWLQRRRFRARQGWQRRGDHVLRSRRLRQVTGPHDRRVARSRSTSTFGYFAEKNGSLTFEGAEGATRSSVCSNPM